MLNKHYYKGLKYKELLNLGSEHNPYKEGTREYTLWQLGNKSGVYTELETEFEEERNSEIIEQYDIHKR